MTYPPEFDYQHAPGCENGRWYWCKMKHYVATSNFCREHNYPATRTDDCVCHLQGETA